MAICRSRGRPRVKDGEDTETVSVCLPASVYDRIAKLALRQDVPLAVIVRAVLTREFSNDKLPTAPS